MKRYSVVILLALIWLGIWPANKLIAQTNVFPVEDSTSENRFNLPYNFGSDSYLLIDSTRFTSPLMMDIPDLLKTEIEYDPENNRYILRNKLGKRDYKAPTYLSVEDYLNYDLQSFKRDFWKQRARSENFEHQRALIPQLHIGSRVFETIFGSNTINIKPRGQATLKFGLKYTKQDNPTLAEELRSDFTFDFDERIQMNVTGKIGENLTLKLSYDTEASFEFENEMNIRYQGNEDDIIQRIEAGNVSLPLNGTLIQGSQNLFGILSEFKFGKLNITTIFSQQKSEAKNITVEGGAQKRRFEVQADEYDDNRHYFLSHYFRDKYEDALKNYPQITRDVFVEEIEVWVLNKNAVVENTRNIVALTDLGEFNDEVFQSQVTVSQMSPQTGFPENSANNLYDLMGNVNDIATAVNYLEGLSLENGSDYEVIESARKLSTSEYTLNRDLGFISLNMQLRSDEILAVSYRVNKNGDNQNKVGELASANPDGDSTNLLIVKLLKPTSFSPRHKSWDLMMKNIYKLDAYSVSREDFMLDVMYNDVAVGTDVFTLPTDNEYVEGVTLLKLMNLDRMNAQGNFAPNGDGIFDFEEGITINASRGYVIFPVLEPFGSHLEKVFTNNNPNNEEYLSQADQFTYNVLYDSTKTFAEQITEKNKFSIQGTYKSSTGSEIPLNAINIPKGSVKVTAGGMELTENVHYKVDYYLGRVKILDQGLLSSGTPINISLESNTLFSIQSKTLLGATMEYRVNEDLMFGGSILNLTERPLTQKVNVGSEPISNTIMGVNVNYEKEVPLLTKLVDKLPFIETKAPSKIIASAEFAYLKPGHNKAIKHTGEAYLDDFEGATADITLKEPYYWFLASTPKRFIEDYEASGADIYNYNRNRAQLSWYFIDPLYYEGNSPVSDNGISSLNTFQVKENQIFPNRDPEQGVYNALSVFNLSFFPSERGPYNYDKRVSSTDSLLFTDERWAGIQRNVSTSDFEESNIEFIEFWMMDPYAQDELDGIVRNDPNPALYINLGNISEDILKDGRRSVENAIPKDGSTVNMDSTAWGYVSNKQTITTGFEDDGRDQQDVGYDGLTNEREVQFFINNNVFDDTFLGNLTETARNELLADPSQDDFLYHKEGFFDGNSFYKNNLINRYRYFTNPHGNTPSSNASEVRMQTSIPNNEDINDDNTLNQIDAYYEYKVDLSKENLDEMKKYIVDENEIEVDMPNGDSKTVTWYQFKIPIEEPDLVVGNISDFRSIRFIRMYMTGFTRDVTLRFAELNFIRGEWRKYDYVLEEGGEVVDDDIDLSNTQFEVSTVNIEENGQRSPVNYVMPPDVDRVIDPSNSQLRQLNEQSISMRVRDLPDGFAKAIYKNIRFDMRQYKRLKMFIHAEKLEDYDLNDDDLTVFVRLGTDIRENYYEYEIPVKVTPPGSYSNNSGDRKMVWPSENELNIPLSLFTDTKLERNQLLGDQESGVSLLTEYQVMDGSNKVKVRGNPSLSDVVTFTIGVRNPRDDRQEQSGEIWVNELRLTEFDQEGGWAANARITAQLADLGSVTVAGATSKPGFGGLEEKLNERQLDEIYQYDINTSLQLGQFFPQESGIKIPMYFGYAETFINPEYNPLDQDIKMEDALKVLSGDEQEELLRVAREYNMRKSLNFTGVRFGKAGEKPRFYDVSNWTFSYAFTQVYDRNINLRYHNQKRHTGSVNYVFNNRVKPWEPLKNIKLSAKYFGLIKDFNLNYAPSQYSFSTVVTRKYNKMKRRNLNIPDQIFLPTYDKDFRWDRNYGLVYNLSKSIKLSYNAKVTAQIDEPAGVVERGKDNYTNAKDSIITSIKQLGRMTDYNQTFDATWQVPINKIPGLKWMNATAGYNGLFNWRRAPILSDSALNPGNDLSNSNRYNAALNLSFDRLFKNVEYIDQIHKKFKKPLPTRFKEKIKFEVTYTKEKIDLKAGEEKKVYHKLGTEKIKVLIAGPDKKEIKVPFEIVDEKRILLKPDQDLEGVSLTITGEKERSQSPFQIATEYLVRITTGLKSVRFNYTQNNGSIASGFKYAPTSMGMNFNDGEQKPGWEYVFGLSDIDFMERVIENGWLSEDLDNSIIQPYTMTFQENLTINGTFEPLNGLEIKLKSQFARSRNTDRYYLAYGDNTISTSRFDNPTSKSTTGNWSMSVWTFSSTFDKIDDRTYENNVYREFINNRLVIAKRLEQQRIDALGNYAGQSGINGFPDGYPAFSQEVTVPAFISAYVDGPSANNVVLKAAKPIMSLLRPDWRVEYDGFMQFGWFKRKFRNFKVLHSYKGVFTMGGFSNNPDWIRDISAEEAFSSIRNADSTMFAARYNINQITISEDFMPFFEVNMTWKSNITTRVAFNKSRTISLNTSDNNLAESRRTELVLGSGYRFDNLTLVFRTRGGGQRKFDSPVELRADFSVKDDVKYVHKPDDGFTELVSGTLVYKLGFTADYRFSKNLELRAFLDYTLKDPKIQTTFKTTEINFGFSFTFKLVDAG